MDKKFLRILDKGCTGINGALHIDAIKRFEVEEDGGFNVYAYTDSQRYLVNGFGSRIETEEFMKQVSDTVYFDVEYRAREVCRELILSYFKDRFNYHLKFSDVCSLVNHDFNMSYCDETLIELVREGYLVEIITRDDNVDNEYFCPQTPPPEAIRNMVSRAFNNVILNDATQSVHTKMSLRMGCRMYYPNYPDDWVEQLYGLMLELGYLRVTTDEDKEIVKHVSNKEDFDVFVVSRPKSTYDEDNDATWYNVDAFVTAIEERNRK